MSWKQKKQILSSSVPVPAGLFAALHLPQDKQILMITKDEVENSDSFLAQGGICVLHDKDDYDSFMEDTLKAGSL